MEAKVMSKAFKWIATAAMLVLAVLKWTGVLRDATMSEIIALCSAMYGLGAGTIDLNIMFDKFAKHPHVDETLVEVESTEEIQR